MRTASLVCAVLLAAPAARAQATFVPDEPQPAPATSQPPPPQPAPPAGAQGPAVVVPGSRLRIFTYSQQTVEGTFVRQTESAFVMDFGTTQVPVPFSDMARIDLLLPGGGVQPVIPPRAAAPAQPYAPQQPAPYSPPPPPPVSAPGYGPAPGPGLNVATTRVSFFARDGRTPYTVTLMGQSCVTPCSLNLSSGSAQLIASGRGMVTGPVYIPPGGANVYLAHTSGGAVAGSVTMTVGSAVAVAGAFVMLWVSLLGGLIVVAAGVVTTIIGLIIWASAPKAGIEVRAGPALPAGPSPGFMPMTRRKPSLQEGLAVATF